MTTKEAILCFERQCASGICTEADKIALAALREKAEREKNEPLTLAELRKMNGEPVWVEPLIAAYGSGKAWRRYGFINGEKVEVPGVDYWSWWLKNYGKTWIAYRRKPKEAQA